MPATQAQIRNLARTIAAQAGAIADGTLTGPVYAQARGILSNTETLAACLHDPAT